MSAALIELHMLPSLEYFCAIFPFEKIVLEKYEHFNKQSYRNRCYILSAHGIERVTIPVTTKYSKTIITDVKIDSTIRWQAKMWRTLESAYANSPFYEHYADDLRKELFCRHTFLYEMNFSLLSMCLQWLKWDKTISESVAYEKNPSNEIDDLRSLISAKKDFRKREFYQPQPYQQVFGSNFAANLSVIDLVFSEGPHAPALLKASRKKSEQIKLK